MIVIGSTAACCNFSNFPRKPRDLDVLATENDAVAWFERNREKITSFERKLIPERFVSRMGRNRVEFCISRADTSCEYMLNADIERKKQLFDGLGECQIATPVELMAIKRSHLFIRLRKWAEHMNDYHWFKKRVEIDNQEYFDTLLGLRTKEAGERSRQAAISLNKTNDEFFAQSQGVVKRNYEHDDLHLATCNGDRPLYEQFKTDLNKAALSKKLFDEADLETQLQLVREEAYAIALERFLIPERDNGNNPRPNLQSVIDAYDEAIKMICTTLCRGWFRDFAIDHYPSLRLRSNFWDRFLDWEKKEEKGV